MRLIGQIVVEYLIDLFNRTSRDYREVSKKLSEMKSRDKVAQQEERIRTQTMVATVSSIIPSLFPIHHAFSGFSRRSRYHRSYQSTRQVNLSNKILRLFIDHLL